jgi:hypothetical protein
MKKLITIVAAIILIAAAWYLFRVSGTTQTPVTDSENLNTLLGGAPINSIELNRSTPDTLVIPAEHVMSPRFESEEMLQSFSSTQAISFGDYLIVLEFLTENVAAYSQTGEFIQKLGGGELSQATSITSNSDSLYIYDYGIKQVHVYDSELSYKRSFPFNAPYYTQGSLKVNGDHIAYQREEASGFRMTDSGVNRLLSVAPLEQPESTIADLIPRIVPSGKHPGGFNNLLFSMNVRSDIVSSYPALPYLFVYRNFGQYRNIQLVSTRYKEIENPDLTPFQPVMGEAVRINNLMDDLYLRDNGDILLFSFGQLHHIQLQRNGEYMYNQSYVLKRGDSDDILQSISSIDGSSTQPRTLYIVSSGVLFKVELPV